MPTGDQWKDIGYVTAWKAGKRQKFQDKWRDQFPSLLAGVPLAVDPGKKFPPEAIELMQWESESLTHRAHRLELADKQSKPATKKNSRSRHQVPTLIAKDGDTWVLAPAVSRAAPAKLEKSKAMVDLGLTSKAQRELACGLLGAQTECRTGHSFRVSYQCGNRYCVTCGPLSANRLFARKHDRLLFVAQRLLLCGSFREFDSRDGVQCLHGCDECANAITEKRLPHWPPPRGHKPGMVCAKLDFTLRHDGTMPAPALMRKLNLFIKRFCRVIEKRFRIRRDQYGLAYCDELGGNNTNPHAHAIYVGPWLPQEKKQLSTLWNEITDGSFVLSIKYADDFSKALYHAVKYPAKFAERSTATRLAALEAVFHRVRRFHTLAAFYAPEAPESEKPPTRRCPICSEQLSEPKGWETIAALTLRGLPDLRLAEQDAARSKGLLGSVALPP
jgi:hypothetical protein